MVVLARLLTVLFLVTSVVSLAGRAHAQEGAVVVAQGAAADEAPVAQQPVTQQPVAYQPVAQQPVVVVQPAPTTYAVSRGTHMDVGLILAGSLTFGLGYIGAIVIGSIFELPLLYIPVVGGAVNLTSNTGIISLSVGLPLFAVQTVGVVVLIAGLASNIPDEPQRAASWTPRLASGPGDVGLSLRWTL